VAITSQVDAVVKAFRKENPKTGKVELTGADRSIEAELDSILDPGRKEQYPVILKAFTSKFKVKELPSKKEMTPEQKKWCEKFIKDEAGKPPPNGHYAHVRGRAQDVSVKNLKKDERQKLRNMLEKAGFHVTNEKISNKKSTYYVTIDSTTVFHVVK
jgi:hypothetical protein